MPHHFLDPQETVKMQTPTCFDDTAAIPISRSDSRIGFHGPSIQSFHIVVNENTNKTTDNIFFRVTV